MCWVLPGRQKQILQCGADCKAREAAWVLEMLEWVLPRSSQAASRKSQKQSAGEPLTWPSNHWGGSLLNLPAAALQLEIPF